MSHHHSHGHHHHNATKNIFIAFVLNILFAIAEFIVGLLTNSIAIIADSFHDLGDSLSLGLSLILSKISNKSETEKFSYGYKRFSLLGALINSITLIVSSIIMIYHIVPRFFNPESSNYKGMLIFSIVGIAVNGFAALRLISGNTLNEKVLTWHLLEDVLGWVLVLVVSIVNLYVEIKILDPLLASIFTGIILFNIVKNLRKILFVFLQATPHNLDIENLKKEIIALDKIDAIHDMHLWSLDGESHILSLHVVVASEISSQSIIQIKEAIRSKALEQSIRHCTIEIESSHEPCVYKDDE